MSNNEKLNNIFQEAKKQFLLPEEKEAIRQKLLSFVQDNPIENGVVVQKPWHANFVSMFYNRGTFKYAPVSLAALMLVLFAGVGTSLAAKHSLPGDLFYPVKTQVNERVLAWATVDAQAKADLYIGFATTRLEEVEKVAAKGQLSDTARAQAEVSFSQNIDNAQSVIGSIDSNVSADVSANLNSTLETTLRAHSQIIGRLGGSKKDTDSTAVFVKEIDKKVDVVAKARQKAEAKIVERSPEEVRTNAAVKLTELQVKIIAVSRFADDNKDHVSQETYRLVQEGILGAGATMAQGQEKLETGDSAGAYLLFQEGLRALEKIQIDLKAGIRIGIKLELQKGDTPQASAPPLVPLPPVNIDTKVKSSLPELY